ncbi:hypothetical protein B0H13DRAFT_1851925 [Mycena leptocephala]|nr:hypothetical protein B0H13DRAFT_1851925 [Mycena leptocephala]
MSSARNGRRRNWLKHLYAPVSSTSVAYATIVSTPHLIAHLYIADAPARLRQELEKVLALQTQIDAVETSIAEAKRSIFNAGPASYKCITLLIGLMSTHERLQQQAEALYTSLNIQETFPELKGLPLDFVRTLLLMRDLKINIRKRAVGSFLEWENLDRAVAGQREALAILRSIAKFNQYCADLEKLRPATCNLPIPRPLSTQLNGLRDDPALHEDVWITPSQGRIHRWLDDEDVRDGIRSLHSFDRCGEEAIRLNQEQRNIHHWLEQELAIIAHTIQTDPTLEFALRERREELENLQLTWASVRPLLNPSPHVPRVPISAASHASVATHHTSRVSVTTHHGPVSASVTPTSALSRAPAPTASSRSVPAVSSTSLTVQLELTAEDLFEGGEMAPDDMVVAEEVAPGILSNDEVLVMGEMLEKLDVDDDEETSGVEGSSVQCVINWEVPVHPHFIYRCVTNSLQGSTSRRQPPPSRSGAAQ